jgi:ABC-type multidrug transport system fused ATPase/permease subunit
MENQISEVVSHVINFSVPYLSSIPYFSDARVMIASSALLHILFNKIYTKWSFKLFNNNIIIIKYSDPYGLRIMKYIYKNHMNGVSDVRLVNSGVQKEIIEKLKKDICVEFEKNKIYISINKDTSGQNNDKKNHLDVQNDFLIVFKSKAAMEIIKSFIEKIANENSDINLNNTINTYYVKITHNDKNKEFNWENISITTNKELKYVFVSDIVQSTFLNVLNDFMSNEQYFKERGIPYKKTFCLYGKPGCGKTSLIKAICVEYNMPVFVFDMSSLTNDKLISLLFEINYHIKKGQKYVVLIEDFDRVIDLISSRYHQYNNKDLLSMDCILNFLDGIDE